MTVCITVPVPLFFHVTVPFTSIVTGLGIKQVLAVLHEDDIAPGGMVT